MKVVDDAILNHVLTVGPYKGVPIGEAANLRKDGTWNVRLMEDGIIHDCPAISWMIGYLSQCDRTLATGRVVADMKEIATFLVAIEPYKPWAGEP